MRWVAFALLVLLVVAFQVWVHREFTTKPRKWFDRDDG